MSLLLLFQMIYAASAFVLVLYFSMMWDSHKRTSFVASLPFGSVWTSELLVLVLECVVCFTPILNTYLLVRARKKIYRQYMSIN